MALSDIEILKHMKEGAVVITPFKKDNLATSSYDVSLGEWFFREKKPKNFVGIYNIYDKEHTENVWGITPERAEKASKIIDTKYMSGISPDDKIILLSPGETILAHTEEFIGGKNCVTTMMKARSTMGRNFIEVCKCAGWGDVGYINRWTMEVTNNSQNYTIPLVVGRRIAQIIFFYTGPILEKDYTKNGKYQTSDNLKTLKKTWKPEDMIPKMWKDREIFKKK